MLSPFELQTLLDLRCCETSHLQRLIKQNLREIAEAEDHVAKAQIFTKLLNVGTLNLYSYKF